MREKIDSEIRRIDFDDASFQGTGAYMEPTLVNFVFGNNGAGKTTIAEAIDGDRKITWRDHKSYGSYQICKYNLEYIRKNIQESTEIPGLITVNETNVTKAQIDALKKQQEDAEKRVAEIKGDIEKKEKEKDSRFTEACGNIWDKTKTLQTDYSKALSGKRKSKVDYGKLILTIPPKDHDKKELERTYASAYEDSKRYDNFNPIADTSFLDNTPGIDILGKPITSSAEGPFADFMRNIQATAWVKQGRDNFEYHEENGEHKCPYCQRVITDDIEEELKKSFDNQYQTDIGKLHQLQSDYGMRCQRIHSLMDASPAEVYPQIDITKYQDKVKAIKGKISENLTEITKKVADPALKVEITSLADDLKALNEIIAEYNNLIDTNNQVVDNKRKMKAQCEQAVLELIAYEVREELVGYKKDEAAIEKEIDVLKKDLEKQEEAIDKAKKDIEALGPVSTVETDTAMENIKKRLHDSGFDSFTIRKKVGSEHSYEIIRPDGKRAENLSEGERNFLGFLYFNEQVRGQGIAKVSEDGKEVKADTRDKIVVIDDPVSSMDSKALFIVGSLVRDMVEICHNNVEETDSPVKDKSIKQIFILTHNAYFHREVTYDQVKNYLYVSFYLLQKTGTKSRVKLCRKPDPKDNSEYVNVNPVSNTYAALWNEYRELIKPDILASTPTVTVLSVVRRILEEYFIQLCGYSGKTLDDRILNDSKSKKRFDDLDPSGQAYQMATAMLLYISASAAGLGNEVYYDDSLNVANIDQVFQTIFKAMDQDQHYRMMMELD